MGPPVWLPFWTTGCTGRRPLWLPQRTAQLMLTLPRVFLRLAVVRPSCYFGSLVLWASLIPSVGGVGLLDVEQACIFLAAGRSALSLVDRSS